jgi:hypothetical protein
LTEQGWLYLAIVLDLFNREVVGWSIKPRMTADLSLVRLYWSASQRAKDGLRAVNRRALPWR